LFVIVSLERDYLQKSKIFSGDPGEGELVSFTMHALHAAFFMPLLLFQNKVLGRKKA
jgi:hypothetical protein